MYFWRLEDLKSELASRSLSTREELTYLIAFVALSAAAASLPYISYNMWDVILSVMTIVLAIGGTIYIYHQNGGANGIHFLQRYLAIGWVVALHWMIIFIFAVVALFAALEFGPGISDNSTWYECLVVGVFELIIYVRIGHHVNDVAQRSVTN